MLRWDVVIELLKIAAAWLLFVYSGYRWSKWRRERKLRK
jgi:hypothetical protein